MMEMTLPLQNNAECPQYFAEMMTAKKEQFVSLCLQWDSARQLADNLAEVGYEASERTVTNWRNRSFKRVPYGALQAVKYLAEYRLITKARARAERIREGLEAL